MPQGWAGCVGAPPPLSSRPRKGPLQTKTHSLYCFANCRIGGTDSPGIRRDQRALQTRLRCVQLCADLQATPRVDPAEAAGNMIFELIFAARSRRQWMSSNSDLALLTVGTSRAAFKSLLGVHIVCLASLASCCRRFVRDRQTCVGSYSCRAAHLTYVIAG